MVLKGGSGGVGMKRFKGRFSGLSLALGFLEGLCTILGKLCDFTRLLVFCLKQAFVARILK